jgi:pyruvate dehydrogenase E1 component alpha subunit
MLVEAVTYRVAAHTNSDDPTRYIPADELASWRARDPIERFRALLVERGQWDDTTHAALVDAVEARLERIIDAAFAQPLVVESAFDHRSAGDDPRLRRQRDDLVSRLAGPPSGEDGVSWRP